MRIILDNGAYSLRNMGDVAMLQTTVKRLRNLAGDPQLMIMTTNPELLRRYCPGTEPLSVKSRDLGYDSTCPARTDWQETWARLKLRWRSAPGEAREFQDALTGAQAVFLCGGGFLNDVNPYQTRPVLRMLADAAHRGKSTALFSQGLGPLESPELLALLRRTCIAGTRAALRESLYGPDLMHRAQARPGQCTVTGDDAVEMSWQRRAAAPGNALGFSLRKVAYSEVEQTHLAQTAEALKALIKTLGTKVVPLPISFNDHERDDEIIAQVLGIPALVHPLDDPETLISATSECRVLLTGTYHAAVFALAQGIPCVCFYVSNYYRLKMIGLARQFPGGCEVVDLKSSGAIEQLVKNTLRFWESTGPQLRASLLKSAEAQVQTGRAFYGEVMSKILGRTKQPS